MWPSSSFRRSFTYYVKRLSRVKAEPHSVALGLAIGIFFAFSPLLGAHIVLSVLFAWAFAANIPTAIIGTALANPISLPFMWGAAYKLGAFLLHRGGGAVDKETAFRLQGLNWRSFINMFGDINFAKIWHAALAPWFLGCTILGLIFAILSYWSLKLVLIKYRNKKLKYEMQPYAVKLERKDKNR